MFWNDFPVNQSVPIGTSYDWGGSGDPPEQYYTVLHSSSVNQIINLTHRRHQDGTYRSGGPWLMLKEYTRRSPSEVLTEYRLGWAVRYVGRHVPDSHVGSYRFSMTATQARRAHSNLSTRGAEAWNALRPDAPDFSFAVSVMELRETFFSIKSAVNKVRKRVDAASRKRKRKNGKLVSRTGQWWLAIQFGWLPIYRDVVNFSRAQRSAQKRLRQLIKDAEKPVRRRTRLWDTESAEDEVRHLGYNEQIRVNVLPGWVTQGGYYTSEFGKTTTASLRSNTWAVGRFRYFLPPGPRDVAWRKKMWRRIMGMRLTPSELYQVMPWSWLIDYFTTLGEFIDSVSGGVSDRLAADYCYLMRTYSSKLSTVATSGVYVSKEGARAIVSCSQVSERVVKMRVPGSPFGWGIKQSDLSPMQLSILAALGVSRL